MCAAIQELDRSAAVHFVKSNLTSSKTLFDRPRREYGARVDQDAVRLVFAVQVIAQQG